MELLMFLTFGFIISFSPVRATGGYFCKCANIDNWICTNNLIWTMTGIRTSQCFLKCQTDNMCKAVFYNEMTSKCQGHSSLFISQDTCTVQDGTKCYQKCQDLTAMSTNTPEPVTDPVTLSDTVGTVSTECETSYANVSQDINEGFNSPCRNNATCINTDGGSICNCTSGWTGNNCTEARMSRMPVNCKDIQFSGQNVTGIYTIYPDENSNGVSVRCDMDTDGGGWTVLQRRVDGSVDFFRNWTDYKYGFGNATTEYWIGLDTIHKLTSQRKVKLRVDLITPVPKPTSSYASYTSFSVGNETSKYLLTVAGYTGVAGDSLSTHSGMMFTTPDRDNDKSSSNCAVVYSGAWWHKACHDSNLNGIYGSVAWGKGINWYTLSGWSVSMTFSEMKIK